MKVINNSFEFQEKDLDCKVSQRMTVDKGWGWLNGTIGEVFAYHVKKFDGNDQTDLPKVETVKLLYIAKDKRLSTHYHLEKSEIFVCANGSIKVVLLNAGQETEYVLVAGDAMKINPGRIHYMMGLGDNNVLLEVSTEDKPGDSYRLKEGDQLGKAFVKTYEVTEEEKAKLDLVKDLDTTKIQEALSKISVPEKPAK